MLAPCGKLLSFCFASCLRLLLRAFVLLTGVAGCRTLFDHAAGHGSTLKTGRDNSNTDFVAHVWIDNRTKNHFSIFRSRFSDKS